MSRPLESSATSVETFSVNAGGGPATYFYRACVDSVPAETITSNNCSTSVAQTVSKLIVSAFSVSNSSLTTGDSFTLNATVRNDGTGAAAATTLRYYRSSDSTISSGDTK